MSRAVARAVSACGRSVTEGRCARRSATASARVASLRTVMITRIGTPDTRRTMKLNHRSDASSAPAFITACHRATRGNPLFLLELLTLLRDRGVQPDAEAARSVADVGPAQVGELVLRRLDALGREGQALVRAAAILGDGAAP